MIKSFSILAFMAALATAALGQSPIPANVMVATEEVEGSEFTSWIEEEGAKYDGTYTGDVGGDGTGKFVFKTAEGEDGSAIASATYTHTLVGMAPIVVKIEKALCFGDPNNVYLTGAFDIVFVKYGKVRGVIVGNVFIPKKQPSK